MPEEFNVHLFERATESGVVYGSKAVGEPPLMEAFSVREALRQAAGAFGPAGWSVSAGQPGHAGSRLLGGQGRARRRGAVRAARPGLRGGVRWTGSAPCSSCGTTGSPACW